MAIKVCYFTSKDDNDIRVFHKECRSLANNGYDVSLVCPNSQDRVVDGVRIYGVTYKSKSDFSRFFVLSRKLFKKALEIDADIYHFNDPASLPYGSILKSKGKKVIFDVFEDHPSMWNDRGIGLKRYVSKMIAYIYERYELAQCRKFDAVFVCYHWTRDRFLQVRDRVELLLNFPIVDKSSIYKKKNYNKGENINLCYAGTISSSWNIDTVIRAIDRIDGVTFQLAGWSPDYYMSEMKQTPGWSKVKFWGRLNKTELYAKVYEKSDIGLALFNYSPLCHGKVGNMSNNKLFEYMLMGMPIICTDFDLWKNVIEGNKCGICVEPNDTKAIANAVKYLKEHREEANQMGLNGQRAVLENFNWNSQEVIMLDVYSEIVKSIT